MVCPRSVTKYFPLFKPTYMNRLDALLVLGKRGSKRLDKKKRKAWEDQIAKDAEKAEPEDTTPEETETPKAKETETPKADNPETMLAKLKKISDPQLLIINPNVSDTLAEDENDEQVAEKSRQAYEEFLSDRKEILKSSVNLTNEDNSVWVIDGGQKKDLDERLRFHQIAKQFIPLPNDFLEQKEPFADIKVKLKGVDRDAMRDELSQIWSGLIGETEDTKDTESGDGQNEENKTSQEGEEDQKGDDGDEESKILDALPDPEVDQTDDSINLKKIRGLKDPYLFVLSPSEPDNYQTFVKNSKILPKLQQEGTMFLESGDKKKVGASQKGISVYFVSGNDKVALLEELKVAKPAHMLGPLVEKGETIDTFFNTENPFTDLSLSGKKLDARLVEELNAKWRRHTAESSGNRVPAVQVNALVPLNYFRLLNKEQREIEMYLGDRPSGAGLSGAAYITTKSDTEATSFVNLIKKFKMPSLFYKHLYADSDIDPKFKSATPIQFKPSNVLVLIGKFNPNAPVEITKDSLEVAKDLIPSEIQKAWSTRLQLTEQTTQVKQADKLLKESNRVIKEFTQLDILDSFAKNILKNPTKNSGAFVKSQYFIGTQIVHFNADMTICFLWGAITQKATLDKGEVLKQLPFVDKLITSYL